MLRRVSISKPIAIILNHRCEQRVKQSILTWMENCFLDSAIQCMSPCGENWTSRFLYTSNCRFYFRSLNYFSFHKPDLLSRILDLWDSDFSTWCALRFDLFKNICNYLVRIFKHWIFYKILNHLKFQISFFKLFSLQMWMFFMLNNPLKLKRGIIVWKKFV